PAFSNWQTMSESCCLFFAIAEKICGRARLDRPRELADWSAAGLRVCGESPDYPPLSTSCWPCRFSTAQGLDWELLPYPPEQPVFLTLQYTACFGFQIVVTLQMYNPVDKV